MSRQVLQITWQAEDIQELRPTWTLDQCEEWLSTHSRRLEDQMVGDGWEAIRDRLMWFDPTKEESV
jgi:hypothetical protein